MKYVLSSSIYMHELSIKFSPKMMIKNIKQKDFASNLVFLWGIHGFSPSLDV